MRFSEAYEIHRAKDDDWFDPHLTVDTKLFIDPLLLEEAGGIWAKHHEKLLAYFANCYELVAKGGNPRSPSARAALRLLTFPEPYEFGLGYTTGGTRGAGSGRGFAKTMLDGIAVAIARGLERPEHIEEIGILNEGIGADRISDAVANVLKQDFIRYTQEVVRRHSLDERIFKVKNARFSLSQGRWVDDATLLPVNPKTEGPIILVPEFILNELPILNADSWYESSLNEDIRESLNLQVGSRVNKKTIVDLARRNPDRVRQWARDQTSRQDLKGYDFDDDPLGVVKWDRAGAEFSASHPLGNRKIDTEDDLCELLSEIIENFRHFVEQERGWKLLWKEDNDPKPEEAVQLAFLGVAKPYLRLFGVEIDREVELGRGPVDFKVANGTVARVLIEVKKLNSGKFWHGIEKQLPSYLKSDGATHGWLIAVQYTDSKSMKKRKSDLPGIVERIVDLTGKRIKFTVIDARPRMSASKLEDLS